MKFTLNPMPGEAGFIQWKDAMKALSRLPGGVPKEFRKSVSILRLYSSNPIQIKINLHFSLTTDMAKSVAAIHKRHQPRLG